MTAGSWWGIISLGVGAFVVVCLLIGLILAVTGCAPNHDPYLAGRFEAFNYTVQEGLEDCRLDPNACAPTLELMAAELEVWTEILTDPNL